MSLYAVVSIGNSDDKLTQKEWNSFVEDVIEVVGISGKVHFFGGSSTFAPWQNVAWIVEIKGGIVEAGNAYSTLRSSIQHIREKYKQDSVFLMTGEALFV